MQPAVPQLKVYAPATSSAKTFDKKKKSPLDDLSGDALYALLKQKWREEEATDNATSEEGSKASSKASVVDKNPYYPYNQEFFGHDEDSTPDLGEN